MLQMAGVQDGYCLRDLIKPDRSRIQKNLSAVINLYKFKESIEEEHQPLVDRSVSRLDRLSRYSMRGATVD